jgi:Rrf2 family protein
MSLISNKGNYGLQAMLILSKHQNKELLQIKEISHQGNIPKNYLEQILVILKKESLVQSTRGANGGYKLAKSAKDIKVNEILEALESCFNHNSSTTNELDAFWQDSNEKIKEVFSLSLQELEEFIFQNNASSMYHI